MITAKWGNLDDALRNIQALGQELATEEVCAPALMAAGKELHEEIVRTAPRSPVPPHVADSFVVKLSKEEREFGRTTVLVGAKGGRGSVGFVAPFLEFGTSEMSARPFIRPAYDAFRGWFPVILADHLRRQYERVVRKYVRRAKP